MKGFIEEVVDLSNKRWFNTNLRVILSLLDLLRVSDLTLLSKYLTPKCPSDSVKPVNQLLFAKLELSNKLSGVSKLYL
jgi:hypothetical protein